MWTSTLYRMLAIDACDGATGIADETSTPYGCRVRTDRHSTPRRAVGVDDELWDAYGEIVGDGGRSDDIREYITWRIEHPDTPLPGRFRGPVKKVRRRKTDSDA